MNKESHVTKSLSLKIASPQKIRSCLNRSGLSSIENKNLSMDHLQTILKSLSLGSISIEEKNQLLMSLITNQLKNGTRYLGIIRHPSYSIHCSHCGGKGFQVILEVKMDFKPCEGDPSKNSVPCLGSGVKTSLCNRCNGLQLGQTLRIRNEIIMKTASEAVVEKYGHFTKIKVDNITPKFIEQNTQKTFRVFKSDEVGNNGVYYYIPRDPCRSCKGTGLFIHDRKNIKCTKCNGVGHHGTEEQKCETCNGKGRLNGKPIRCPGCGGKGHKSKSLVSTNKVKSFIHCGRCEGLGSIPSNPVINIKTMPKDVIKSLEKSGLLNTDPKRTHEE